MVLKNAGKDEKKFKDIMDIRILWLSILMMVEISGGNIDQNLKCNRKQWPNRSCIKCEVEVAGYTAFHIDVSHKVGLNVPCNPTVNIVVNENEEYFDNIFYCHGFNVYLNKMNCYWWVYNWDFGSNNKTSTCDNNNVRIRAHAKRNNNKLNLTLMYCYHNLTETADSPHFQLQNISHISHSEQTSETMEDASSVFSGNFKTFITSSSDSWRSVSVVTENLDVSSDTVTMFPETPNTVISSSVYDHQTKSAGVHISPIENSSTKMPETNPTVDVNLSSSIDTTKIVTETNPNFTMTSENVFQSTTLARTTEYQRAKYAKCNAECSHDDEGCQYICELLVKTQLPNMTTDELKEELRKLKSELQVDKSNLSIAIRRKISVGDDRPSAIGLGALGITVIVVVVTTIVSLDVINLVKYMQRCRELKAISPEEDDSHEQSLTVEESSL